MGITVKQRTSERTRAALVALHGIISDIRENPSRMRVYSASPSDIYALLHFYNETAAAGITDSSIFITSAMREILEESGFPMVIVAGCYFVDESRL